MQVLPAVVEAMGATTIPVMIDGGFRRGNDVLLALALGAKFVFVGRPLAVCGDRRRRSRRARARSRCCKDEIDRDLALLGIRSPSARSRGDLVRKF